LKGEVINLPTMGVFTTHSPRLFYEEGVKEPFLVLLNGMKKLGEDIEAFEPDVIAVISTHWFSTFNIYVNGAGKHEGLYTAQESPELLNRIQYEFPGDRLFASSVVEEMKQAGLRGMLVDDGSLLIDYGTLVPMKYLEPTKKIPIVPISICMNSNMEQFLQAGRAFAKVSQRSGKRVVFVASGSLSHYHSFVPEDWPTPDNRQRDQEMINYMQSGQWDELADKMEYYSKASHMEGWGYHVGMLLGVLQGSREQEFQVKEYGYGPSSGSGNNCISFIPTKVEATV
jgi:3,4-dihydroxyphenylacetate 2,3-dioxygenase